MAAQKNNVPKLTFSRHVLRKTGVINILIKLKKILPPKKGFSVPIYK